VTTQPSGGGNQRQRTRKQGQGGGGRRSLVLLAAIGAVIVVAAVVLPRMVTGAAGGASKATATPTAQASGVAAATPAVALPKSCPDNTIPGVNNIAKYGFCTPAGWGAWNNNNQVPLTQIIKARYSDSPVVQVTDFDRIQVVVFLNTGSPGDSAPADCRGAPNDAIDGLATHHCGAALDPDKNPYHAVRAEYWMVDLFGNQQFYMTAFLPSDATPDDEATVDLIVHNVKPANQ
jgi:hypothetical protein